jgi:thiol:disulfide interchange protein DsbA
MNSIRNLLPIAATLFVVACGGAETSQNGNAPAEPAPTAPAAQTATAENDAAVPAKVAAESAAPTANDERIVLAEADTAASSAATGPLKYVEGQHFSVLTTAQGTSSSPDVIEVAEVFWYGCPHCYSFDPYVTKWETTLPEGVELMRLPVMWNPTNEIHARMFYTADAVGKLDEMHEAIFQAMHQNGKTLTSEDDIQAFFGTYGVSEDEFQTTFRSFPVETRLKKARNLTERYRVQSVPLLIVNGKYVVKGPGVKNYEDMIDVSNELIAREQADQ